MSGQLDCKRIYDPPLETDGLRVLVDRLWPRGVRKADAHIRHWLKDVAPSPQLRTWFGHDPNRFAEFVKLYREELASDALHRQAVDQIVDWLQTDSVTLVYAARDTRHNHAVVLREYVIEGGYRE
ncbi:uncharacterized protein YeaO (DUF488 family) [Alicyclobacillus sacchari]|uniref:Uncharacterized protein YeaO (DUF488 family) n=1 Tax=Alicyclobacillus sacchari TaxID=392010 RepID=A0A4R8LV01_9BACL|nr:DUF488 family protein [Alicyclobacillus sacchari]TDY50645.1 uncharacterized protein YeaO (DUF488 family) [Alicyclobacillus sacchari]GMA55616.1 hypothetical protein GCM10025858_01190 [Alicyclobacillus sacchari]